MELPIPGTAPVSDQLPWFENGLNSREPGRQVSGEERVVASQREELRVEGQLGGADSSPLDQPPWHRTGQVRAPPSSPWQECGGWPHPAQGSCPYLL